MLKKLQDDPEGICCIFVRLIKPANARNRRNTNKQQNKSEIIQCNYDFTAVQWIVTPPSEKIVASSVTLRRLRHIPCGSQVPNLPYIYRNAMRSI